MTYLTTFPSFWDKNFDKFFIGSDHLAKTVKHMTDTMANTSIANFPPYNIVKLEENKYVIEIAVAGFGKQDLEITLEDKKLIIKGSVKADTQQNYLFKGIADRAFTREFTLYDNVELQNAELFNGMLKLWLEHIIPDSKKPRKVEISETGTEKHKKLSV